jgi:hypothetical protein
LYLGLFGLEYGAENAARLSPTEQNLIGESHSMTSNSNESSTELPAAFGYRITWVMLATRFVRILYVKTLMEAP